MTVTDIEAEWRPQAEILAEAHQPGQAAVIDIGSNSVRMVIYRRDGRAAWPVFNEKTLAGLGRGVPETGKLNPEGVETALTTLRRFTRILDARKVEEVTAFATAAVRQATDGRTFRARIRKECGFNVRVLSGEDEAVMAAYGVIAGGADGDGLVGDLGGSSLELVAIADGEPGRGVSLKLGPLAVMTDDTFDPRKARKAIETGLGEAQGVLNQAPRDFHAVGGAWRNLARIDMMLRDYPLNVLHHYEMTRSEALKMTDFVMGQSAGSLSEIPAASSRRAPTLPYAACLMRCLLEASSIQRVVISAYGVREGALFSRLPRAVRRLDPLVSSSVALAKRFAGPPLFGAELAEWVRPVLATLPQTFSAERDMILVTAAASLSDIGAAMHPDHRASLVADQVLYAPFVGLSHPERAFLACALYHRYAGKSSLPEESPILRLMDDEQTDAALRLGLALRLGAVLSARAPNLLGQSRLQVEDGKLVLTLSETARDLAADTTEKRLGQLAGVLGLESRVAFD